MQSKSSKRRMGSYYTPNEFAESLARWAIRSGREEVIDPSFGGCAFLEQALKRLTALSRSDSENKIYGCDIDPLAVKFANGLILKGVPKKNFEYCDFFSSEHLIKRRYDVILANPPYIKHDDIPKNLLESAINAIGRSGVEFSNAVRPNYWYYFFLYAISMLRVNGRMAFVLPQSFLQSKYARTVIDSIKSSFDKCYVLPILDTIFEGTVEKVVVVLCEGKKLQNSNMESGTLKIFGGTKSVNMESRIDDLLSGHIDPDTEISEIYNVIPVKNLASIFDIKIGVVTGGKEYFVLSEDQAMQYKIPIENLTPVYSRASFVDRLVLNVDDSHTYSYLLTIDSRQKIEDDGSLDRYLRSVPEKIKQSYHSRHRSPWYSLKRLIVPDAIIKNIVKYSPVIHTNSGPALCTNNFIRLNRLQLSEFETASVSILSLSSVFRLSAERYGLKYGKSALKFDPSQVAKLVLPDLPQLDAKLIHRASELYAASNIAGAQKIVDEYVYYYFNTGTSYVSEISNELSVLQSKRLDN
jgi:adenine-specific DNA-methyltransferase